MDPSPKLLPLELYEVIEEYLTRVVLPLMRDGKKAVEQSPEEFKEFVQHALESDNALLGLLTEATERYGDVYLAEHLRLVDCVCNLRES